MARIVISDVSAKLDRATLFAALKPVCPSTGGLDATARFFLAIRQLLIAALIWLGIRAALLD
jgi:hypothetical protein